MRKVKSDVFADIDMDINSPMEHLIGGITADIADDIRYGNLQRATVDRLVFVLVKTSVRCAVENRTSLIKYILNTAKMGMLECESEYEKYFFGHVPSGEPYGELQQFERILGHAVEAIINGVIGNLSERGLYHSRRTFKL